MEKIRVEILIILSLFLLLFLCLDPYEYKWQTKNVDASKCNNNCDRIAACACGLVYGDYKCACPTGMAGSGLVGQCSRKCIDRKWRKIWLHRLHHQLTFVCSFCSCHCFSESRSYTNRKFKVIDDHLFEKVTSYPYAKTYIQRFNHTCPKHILICY